MQRKPTPQAAPIVILAAILLVLAGWSLSTSPQAASAANAADETETPTPGSLYLPDIRNDPTPTPLPTPTATPGPVMSEVSCASFPQGSSPGWYAYGCALDDSVYQVHRINVSFSQLWNMRGIVPGRFAIEADAQAIQGSADYRLFFNNITYVGFYAFGVNPKNGTYAIWRVDEEETWVPLVDWTSSPQIKRGGEVNRLRAERNGDQISVFVNGQPLATVTDTTYASGRWWGLFVRNSVASSIVHFTNIRVYTWR